jgi:predicted DNA binding CopG/RHH family protein
MHTSTQNKKPVIFAGDPGFVFLDDEEREVFESVERGEWESVPNFTQEKARLQSYARNTLAKSKAISIRVTQGDFHGIKVKAMQEGIPYQTLISSIIHKYVSGALK